MADRTPHVQTEDINEEMKQDAMNLAIKSLDKFTEEKEMACYVKREFDKKYNPIWHCIVGKHFGSYVSYEKESFLFFEVDRIFFLLFKHGPTLIDSTSNVHDKLPF